MNQKGFFITLEGGEGCGKTTQLRMLGEALNSKTMREVILTRSPGGTNAAEKIRSILKVPDPAEMLLPETELLLFGACHSQMSHTLIRPALERGAILVSDRFYDSTTVYQGYARGLDLEFVRKINEFACQGIKPDLTLLLDIDVEQGLSRAGRRSVEDDLENDRFDSETLTFHQTIRNGFLELARLEPERFRVISAAGTPEDIHAKIMEAVHGLGIL